VPPYIKDRCKSRASSQHIPYLQPYLAHFANYMLRCLPDFRHRIDLTSKLSRVCLVFCLVHHFLPGLRGRGCGDSGRRRLPEQDHPLNAYIQSSPLSPPHHLVSLQTPVSFRFRCIARFPSTPLWSATKHIVESIAYIYLLPVPAPWCYSCSSCALLLVLYPDPPAMTCLDSQTRVKIIKSIYPAYQQ
jgi:hypothetical protein